METKIEIKDLSPFRNYEVSLTQKPADDVNDKYWSTRIKSNFRTSFEGEENRQILHQTFICQTCTVLFMCKLINYHLFFMNLEYFHVLKISKVKVNLLVDPLLGRVKRHWVRVYEIFISILWWKNYESVTCNFSTNFINAFIIYYFQFLENQHLFPLHSRCLKDLELVQQKKMLSTFTC